MKKIFTLIILVFTLFSCSKKENTSSENKIDPQNKKPVISVSIPPLKWITEKITDQDFTVNSVVASNVSPELFDPAIKTIEDLENSDLYFSFDLFNFEHKLEDAISNKNKIFNVLDNKNISLIKEDESGHNEEDSDHDHGDYDPHVWFSINNISSIAENIKNILSEKYPDKKDIFEKNYTNFLAEIKDFKAKSDDKINTKKEKIFIIYHPALTYFAKDNNLTQISVEQSGKEPTAQYLASIIQKIKENNIKVLLVQPQFPKTSTEAISKEVSDVKIVEFNPLDENIFENLNKFLDSLE